MIRRTVTYPSGEKRWLLISQMVHARLAARMAEQWAEPFAGLEPRHVLVAAIYRHEDGWRESDENVRFGQHTRPLDFADEPTHRMLSIWRASIASAGCAGPLASYIVSRHQTEFLLPLFSHRWQSDESQAVTVNEFRAEQEGRQSQWLTEWRPGGVATAQEGSAWLRLFDELSVWLCRGQWEQPHTFEVPGGRSLHAGPDEAGNVVVSPWAEDGVDGAGAVRRGRAGIERDSDDCPALLVAAGST